MPVSRFAYLIVLLIPALLPLAWWLGRWSDMPNVFAFLTPVVLYGLLPALDLLLGLDRRNLGSNGSNHAWGGVYRAITWLCLPAQLAVVTGGGYVLLVLQPFNWIGALGWTLSVGYIGGILAINVAHELIHKRTATDQRIGGLLLATVCYAGFKVEHVRGHHVWVGTPKDPSTSRYNQSLYAFVPNAVISNFSNAWRLEAKRLRELGLAPWHYRNELIGYYAISIGLLAGFALVGGWLGAAYFLLQSAAAFVGLETINYVEHYGLERKRLDDGRYERPAPRHSWNSSHRFTNLFLLQLARHSDHHANPTRPYPQLRHFDDVPQLPAGYPAMYLLALVPPWWKKVMNPRVDKIRALD